MNALAKIFLSVIWIYQRSFSAIMGRQCRFYPTCSAYTAESIRRFGALKGTALGMGRICRCHPWGAAGNDPVPQEFQMFSGGKFSSKNAARCDRTAGDKGKEGNLC
ncbi:MAG: membrane protein insertion efficiency factor YidD [Alphaproteobacteria bacterium]